MNISLNKRIGLCVLSGVGVGAIQLYADSFDWPGGPWIYYASSGLLFAAAVLFPYLQRNDRVFARAFILVIASSASYFAAEWLALMDPFSSPDDWISFTIASVVGAAIVLLALVWMTPLRMTSRLGLSGLVAGLVGGPITNLTLPAESSIVLLGHSSWHILICLAIYFATRKEGRTEVC